MKIKKCYQTPLTEFLFLASANLMTLSSEDPNQGEWDSQ